MSSYRRLDSTSSDVSAGGGSRFRLGLSPSKPAVEQEGEEREDADAKEDALAHSFRAEFPSLTSSHKHGFLRLDSNDEEDDSCSQGETEATETKTKKHSYLKFLGRTRKRTGSPSKSRLLSESSQSSSKRKKGDRKKASSAGRKGAEQREKNVKVVEKKLTSDKGEESHANDKSNGEISIEGPAAASEARDEGFAVATDARDDADQMQQADASAVDELRDGPAASKGQITMQLPCIVRRKEAEEVIRSFDSDNNGSMIDPRVASPSPAWCSNVQVVDDSFMETGKEQEMEAHELCQRMGAHSATLRSRSTGQMLGSSPSVVKLDEDQKRSNRGVSTEALLGSMFGDSPNPPTQHKRSMSLDQMVRSPTAPAASPNPRRQPSSAGRGVSTASLLGPTFGLARDPAPVSSDEKSPQALKPTKSEDVAKNDDLYSIKTSKSDEFYINSAVTSRSCNIRPSSRPSPEMARSMPSTAHNKSPKRPPRPNSQSALASLLGTKRDTAACSESPRKNNVETIRSNPFDQLPSSSPSSPMSSKESLKSEDDNNPFNLFARSPTQSSLGRKEEHCLNPFDQFIAPTLSPLTTSEVPLSAGNINIETQDSTRRRNNTQVQLTSKKQGQIFVLTNAVLLVQSACRSYLARREAMIRLGSVVTIQVIVRQWYHGQVMVKKRAALKMQSVMRQHLAVMEASERRGALLILQSWYRGVVARNGIEYLQRSALLIQTSWRMHTSQNTRKTKLAHVVLIQSQWRGRYQSKTFRREVEQIIIIQSFVRRQEAQKHLVDSRSAAIAIQKYSRGASSRSNYASTVSSIMKVQALARSAAARRKYTSAVRATVRLQALARTRAARKTYLSTMSSIIKLQANMRRAAPQRRYQAALRIALLCQCYARQSKARQNYLSMLKVVIRMQSTVRMASQQRVYHSVRSSAVKVQSSVRRTVAERQYKAAINAVVIVQAAMRRAIDHIRSENAAVAAQKVWRGYKGRSTVGTMRMRNNAAVLVQSYWRRFEANESFVECMVSAVRIQMCWRQYSAKCKVENARVAKAEELRRQMEREQTFAATLIQTSFRRFYSEMTFIDAIIAVTIIQAYTRRLLAKRQYTTLLSEKIRREEEAREVLRKQEQEREAQRKARRVELERLRIESERRRRHEAEEAAASAALLLTKKEDRVDKGKDADAQVDSKQPQFIPRERMESAHVKDERIEARRMATRKESAAETPAEEVEKAIGVGSSPSVKDRIALFSGSKTAQSSSPSPKPLPDRPNNFSSPLMPSFHRRSDSTGRKPDVASPRSLIESKSTDSASALPTITPPKPATNCLRHFRSSPKPSCKGRSNTQAEKTSVASSISLQENRSSDSGSSIPEQPPAAIKAKTVQKPSMFQKPSFRPIEDSSPQLSPAVDNISPAHSDHRPAYLSEEDDRKRTDEAQPHRQSTKIDVSCDEAEEKGRCSSQHPDLGLPLAPSIVHPHRSPSPLTRSATFKKSPNATKSSVAIASKHDSASGSVETASFSFDQLKSRFDKKGATSTVLVSQSPPSHVAKCQHAATKNRTRTSNSSDASRSTSKVNASNERIEVDPQISSQSPQRKVVLSPISKKQKSCPLNLPSRAGSTRATGSSLRAKDAAEEGGSPVRGISIYQAQVKKRSVPSQFPEKVSKPHDWNKSKSSPEKNAFHDSTDSEDWRCYPDPDINWTVSETMVDFGGSSKSQLPKEDWTAAEPETRARISIQDSTVDPSAPPVRKCAEKLRPIDASKKDSPMLNHNVSTQRKDITIAPNQSSAPPARGSLLRLANTKPGLKSNKHRRELRISNG